LASVVERFVSQAHRDAEEKDVPTSTIIRERLSHFEELTGGFEFAEVIRRYWEGHEDISHETAQFLVEQTWPAVCRRDPR
jgi:type II secretory pathway component PulL